MGITLGHRNHKNLPHVRFFETSCCHVVTICYAFNPGQNPSDVIKLRKTFVKVKHDAICL
ncbi:Hypothetical predicted protein [Pelobates cultripes]|uniref:Uncharacterized protein n=1 Tax=Pelobates cultripes TaxID=61616 RepID=A0AAD1TLJ0_PELCU|nr:Hypothetical predicted protein [Pelobates cultripes]